MYSAFYTFFGILSCISYEIWFNIFLLLPLFYFAISLIYGLLSENGRIVFGALRLKSFVRKHRFITLENKEGFRKKVLIIFPRSFRQRLDEGGGEKLLRNNGVYFFISAVFIVLLYPVFYFLISLFYSIAIGELLFRLGCVFLVSLIFSAFSLSANLSIIGLSAKKWNEVRIIIKDTMLISFSEFFKYAYISPSLKTTTKR